MTMIGITRRRGRFLEWAGRGIILLGAGSLFAYTVVADVSPAVSAIGGGALILGLYFGLADWTRARGREVRGREERPMTSD